MTEYQYNFVIIRIGRSDSSHTFSECKSKTFNKLALTGYLVALWSGSQQRMQLYPGEVWGRDGGCHAIRRGQHQFPLHEESEGG